MYKRIVQEMVDNGRLRAGLDDPIVDREVELLASLLGYGAVMDACARLWRRKDPKGALLLGPTITEAEDVLAAPRRSLIWDDVDAIMAEKGG